MNSCQRVVLIRGIPGSGKTSIANLFATMGYFHIEADMFALFYDGNGKYHFKPELVPDAHKWCLHQFTGALARGENVVVANTFVHQHHMQPYIDACKEAGVLYHIIVADNRFNSVHNVPPHTLERMISRFEFASWQDQISVARANRSMSNAAK